MKNYNSCRVLFTMGETAVITDGYEHECLDIEKARKMFEEQFGDKLEIMPKHRDPLDAYFFDEADFSNLEYAQKDRTSRAINRKMRRKHHPIYHSKEKKAMFMGRDWRLYAHESREKKRNADFRRSMYPDRLASNAVNSKSVQRVPYTEEFTVSSFADLFETQEYFDQKDFNDMMESILGKYHELKG